MVLHRLTALAIVAVFSTFLRVSLVPTLNRLLPLTETKAAVPSEVETPSSTQRNPRQSRPSPI
jgi:hypothetical protein